jgi:hypothetical protein
MTTLRHLGPWGSAGQKASVQNAAEASARARRKWHPPEGSKVRGEVLNKAIYHHPEHGFFLSGTDVHAPHGDRGPHRKLLPTGTYPQTPEQKALYAAQDKIDREDFDRREEQRVQQTRAAHAKWLDQPNALNPAITNRQRQTIIAYTNTRLHRDLNAKLRTGAPLTEVGKDVQHQMDTAIEKSPLAQPVTVQRVITDGAVRQQILDNIDNPDYRYVEPSYMSVEAKGTSPSLGEMAARYSGGEGGQAKPDQQIFIEAELPAGAHAFDITTVVDPEDEISGKVNAFAHEEHEYILPRDTSWKIVGRLNVPGAPAPVIKVALVRDEPRSVAKAAADNSYTAGNVASGAAMKKPPKGGSRAA